jgi:AcrR family transcriptional regulator
MPGSDQPETLPRGRHRLTREEVLSSQRGRMLDAMARAVADRGYARATVADVITRARVSRETFYEHFDGKEDCFLAAYELVAGGVRQAAQESLAVEGLDDPLERIDRAVDTYLAQFAAEPALASVFLVDIYGAGPAVGKRRREVFDAFVDTIADGLGAKNARERFACEAFVGALSSLVTVRVAAGDFQELPGLAAPIKALSRRLLDLS